MKISSSFVRRSARLSFAGVALLALSAGAAEPGENPLRAAGPRTVTLITGDQVIIDTAAGTRAVSVLPRKGREHIGFVTTYERDGNGQGEEHAYVIPADALPLIGAGKLDRALFDVTALRDYNYDDTNSVTLPLIVTHQDGQQQRLSAANASVAGAPIARRLQVVNGAALNAPKRELGPWWDSLRAPRPGALGAAADATPQLDSSLEKIWLDRLLKPALDRSAPAIGAPALWNAGYIGEGVFVAVVDTGVDATHPDLAGRVVAARNFTSEFTTEPDTDTIGHGTHVASTIAGSGAASAGRYRGIAPGAQIIAAKVCFSMGCPLSSIIAGMEWAVTEQGAKVVNMSLGGFDTADIDPVEEAVNQLTAGYGALFVVAAGNSGPSASTVGSPASAEAALSVAAIDRANAVAIFSSRGPRVGDRGVKPEISAPGVGIVAARAAGTRIGELVGDSYTALSGTSMATPHVAGAAALLSQRYPQWGPQQLKTALMNSARFQPTDAVFDYGAGRLDVAAAAAPGVTSEPAAFSLGIARWPQEDDEIITRTVTYRNAAAAAATLTLRVAASGPNGNAPPDGLFALSPATLTVPAGGTAAATLTVNTRVAAALGVFSGRLLATGTQDATVVIPLAIDLEEESYDLTLRHIDHNGEQAAEYDTHLFPLDRAGAGRLSVFSVPGDVTLRVPAGRYFVGSAISSSIDFSSPHSAIAHTGYLARSNALLTIDARATTPVDLRAPGPRLRQTLMETGWQWQTPGNRIAHLYALGRPLRTIAFGEPDPGVFSYVSTQWQEQATAASTGNPALYAATWVDYGTLPSGRKVVNLKDMAVVQSTFAPVSPEVTSGLVGVAANVKSAWIVSVLSQPVTFPGGRTEYYYSNDPDVRWSRDLRIPLPGRPWMAFRDLPDPSYRMRHRYQSPWMQSPLGPLAIGSRLRSLMSVDLPLHSDRAGHLGIVAPGLDIKVYRNGELINSVSEDAGRISTQFPVPAERATYRLETTGRQDVFALSSRVSAAWTFDSEYTAEGVDLPLISVRFKPDLNSKGRARRDIPLLMPITVEQFPSKDPLWVANLSVEASFDDGATWKRVPVHRQDKRWIARVLPSKRGDYVSLRATARDFSGNSVEQTIIRAYGLEAKPRGRTF